LSTLLSVNIDNKNIYMAEGGFDKGNLTIGKTQSFEMPSGSIKNEAVLDEILFADAMNRMVLEGGFSSKNVVLSVSSKQALIKELNLPAAKPKEIEGMIKSELYQTFNVSKTDIIQYKPIAETQNENGEKLTTYRVAAMDRDFAQAYYNAADKAKLKPVALDINLNSIDKLQSWLGSVNGRETAGISTALIDFGYSTTTVYVIRDGRLMFYRLIDFGTGELIQILQDVPDFVGDVTTNEGKASEYKIFNGRELAEESPINVKPFFYKLNDELQNTITFFNNRAREYAIERTYLFGTGSELQGLSEYWSANLNVPMENISSIGKTNNSENPLSPLFLNAVGALIRY